MELHAIERSARMMPARHRPLTATYRLQLNGALHAARRAGARSRTSHALGVSHLYCSPVLAARAGSTHGYDVVDPTQVNPELGRRRRRSSRSRTTAHAHGMGLVLDIVPNHMGIGAGQSVLGRRARARPGLALRELVRRASGARRRGDWPSKVLLPVLGDELDAVLERGELALEVTESRRAGALLRPSTSRSIRPRCRPSWRSRMRDPAARRRR